MELKEIFRYTEEALYPAASDVARRYKKLRDVFVEGFVQHFPEGELARCPAPGIVFTPDPAVPLLKVKFCDKEFRFGFEMVSSRGQVTCHLWPRDEYEEPKAIGSFAFNGEGVTDVRPPVPNGDDPLTINNGNAGVALCIVLSFLVAAIGRQRLEL